MTAQPLPSSGESRGDMPREISMMVTHHDELRAQLRRGADDLAAAAGTAVGEARDRLHAFIAGEVIPHALAEEDAIYRAGSEVETLAPLVAGMIMEHHALLELAGRIERDDPDAAPSAAAAFVALFEVHVRKENEILLPGLLAAGTDPARLLATMHRAFGIRKEQASVRGALEPDTDGLMVRDGESVVDTRRPAADSCASLANQAVDALGPDESFLLVADHDPRGIHYMLDAERPGATTWEVLEDGPRRWQARIARIEPRAAARTA